MLILFESYDTFFYVRHCLWIFCFRHVNFIVELFILCAVTWWRHYYVEIPITRPDTHSPSACQRIGPKRKAQKEQYEKIISDNEILLVPSLFEAINTRTISLLTTNIKSRKLIGVNRETMKKYWPGEVTLCRLFCEIKDWVHGHQKDKGYFTWSVIVYHGGLLWICLYQVWRGRGCLVSKASRALPPEISR